MSFLKPCLGRNMTVHAWRCKAHEQTFHVTILGSSSRHHGYAQLTLGALRGAGQPRFQRIAIPEEASPASRCLAGTVLTPDPARVKQAEIIRRLPNFLFPLHTELRTLTFFITPDYVKWFAEDSDFLQNALDHIFQDWSAAMQKLSQPGLPGNYQIVVQTRVAVVDRIPFPDGNSSGYPGISLAASAWSRHWSQTGLATKSGDFKSESKAPLICMRLPFRYEHGELKISSILLQPANTLFVNGLPHTMFADNWVENSEAEVGPKFSRQSPREYIDRITFNHRFHNSSLTVPLQRLTKPRKISMCMGNIISKLVGEGDSESTSASLELEGKVSSFMKSQDATSGTLAVFALVIPKLSAQTEFLQGTVVPPEVLGYDKPTGIDDAASESQRTRDSVRLAISNGAHLHRVTSGGGGWGKKQGLLSLEPALDFGNEEPESASLSTLEASGEASRENGPFWAHSGVSKIAQPGDMVEFFGLFLSKEEEQALSHKESLMAALKALDTKRWHSRDWAQGDLSHIVLGVTPPQDVNVASTLSTLGDKLVTIPHQFGMLSEHGMVLKQRKYGADKEAAAKLEVIGERETNITKIDVPHTSLTYSIANRRASPPQPAAIETSERIRWRVIQSDMPAQTNPTHGNDIDRPRLVPTSSVTDKAKPNKVRQDVQGHRSKPERLTSTQAARVTHQTEPAASFSINNSSERAFKNASRGPSRRARHRRPARAKESGVRIVKYTAPALIRKHDAMSIRKHSSGGQFRRLKPQPS